MSHISQITHTAWKNFDNTLAKLSKDEQALAVKQQALGPNLEKLKAQAQAQAQSVQDTIATIFSDQKDLEAQLLQVQQNLVQLKPNGPTQQSIDAEQRALAIQAQLEAKQEAIKTEQAKLQTIETKLEEDSAAAKSEVETAQAQAQWTKQLLDMYKTVRETLEAYWNMLANVISSLSNSLK